jgi:5-formyltetrahydrofolate cyclo-ligase
MKAALREEMKRARFALSEAEIRRRSARIAERLAALEAFRRAKTVMLYLPVRNEVDTTLAAKGCLNDGKTLVLPRMDYERKRIVAHRVDDLSTQIVLGRMDLMEPDPARAAVAAPEEVDLVGVPGLAFDREGNRIGWGRGYYDAFLAELGARACRVGLAYGFQLVEGIEHDGHDVPMDYIVTDEETVACGRTRRGRARPEDTLR